ncbi:hypothetical protein, partial [Vibrio cholerae]
KFPTSEIEWCEYDSSQYQPTSCKCMILTKTLRNYYIFHHISACTGKSIAPIIPAAQAVEH